MLHLGHGSLSLPPGAELPPQTKTRPYIMKSIVYHSQKCLVYGMGWKLELLLFVDTAVSESGQVRSPRASSASSAALPGLAKRNF